MAERKLSTRSQRRLRLQLAKLVGTSEQSTSRPKGQKSPALPLDTHSPKRKRHISENVQAADIEMQPTPSDELDLSCSLPTTAEIDNDQSMYACESDPESSPAAASTSATSSET